MSSYALDGSPDATLEIPTWGNTYECRCTMICNIILFIYIYMCKYVCTSIERAREMHILEYGIKWIYMYILLYCSCSFSGSICPTKTFQSGGPSKPLQPI